MCSNITKKLLNLSMVAIAHIIANAGYVWMGKEHLIILLFSFFQSSCSTIDDETVSCIVPPNITPSRYILIEVVMYELVMDAVQTPNFRDDNFTLSVKLDPSNFTLITDSVSNSSYDVEINVSFDC